MNNLLKILKLSQSAGDRLVVYNPDDPDNSWVVVSLSDYEKLISKNQENLVNSKEDESVNTKKIPDKQELTRGRQVDTMKSENIENEKQEIEKMEADKSQENVGEEFNQDFSDFTASNISRPVYSDSDNQNKDGSPVSIANVLEKSKGKWKIPNQLKESASEIID